MDLVFLDANVLFSAAYRPTSRLRTLWTLQGIRLLTSAQAVEEARRNLDSPQQRAELMRLIEQMEVTAAPRRQRELPIDLPPDDRMVLLAAIEARATHFLTGDVRHFSGYYGMDVQEVRILTPAEYLRLRGEAVPGS
ncbi:MAG: PIN domain-containing protein [Armatimonadota bacterium]|nr:PIN domain-containing protein [Armatimonadota bacterium]